MAISLSDNAVMRILSLVGATPEVGVVCETRRSVAVAGQETLQLG